MNNCPKKFKEHFWGYCKLPVFDINGLNGKACQGMTQMCEKALHEIMGSIPAHDVYVKRVLQFS
jgi:hypothetical protein